MSARSAITSWVESALLREEADHYALTGLLSAVTIPATLQDSLLARLDRVAAVGEDDDLPEREYREDECRGGGGHRGVRAAVASTVHSVGP